MQGINRPTIIRLIYCCRACRDGAKCRETIETLQTHQYVTLSIPAGLL